MRGPTAMPAVYWGWLVCPASLHSLASFRFAMSGGNPLPSGVTVTVCPHCWHVCVGWLISLPVPLLFVVGVVRSHYARFRWLVCGLS